MAVDTSGNTLLRPLTKDPAVSLTAYRDQHFKVRLIVCKVCRICWLILNKLTRRSNSLMQWKVC